MPTPRLRPLVIAHRGASAECPENTEVAVRRALEQGADGIECDVRLTADGHPVVFHDADLRRLCGSQEQVARLERDALTGREVRVEGRTGAPARVLALEEWLRLVPPSVLAVVELKEQGSKERDLALLAAVEPPLLGRQGPVAVLSFGTRIVKAARRLADRVAIGAIRHRPLRGTASRLLARHARPLVVLHESLLDEGLVRELQQQGREVWSWPLDTVPDLQRALDLGVVGWVTNRPERARAFLDERLGS